ncbi:MFS transporter [Zafaria sp. Z1313]|uniref:MFS transporter n=1 Tax=unclassified Zafaria TaxID=2828765 RepID=UPI002E7A6FE2|nr:MFS transporter [Zafaria sp. J156]MEE1621595.1 MFS transporter [Zafaria sp. J156]
MAPRALRPFAHRDYRILITALAISVFGHGMWAVAMVYQVKGLGGGPAQLSIVATATSIGLLALVLVGGIAADRLSCRRIIIVVEAVSLAVMASTAVLALTGVIELWHLAVAGFIQGAGAAFFFPAYSALLPRILPPQDLLAANGMEGTMRPVLQQAAGPAAAGMIVGALAPAHAIAGVAVCHAVAFVILNLVHHDRRYDEHLAPGDVRPSVVADLREGVVYTVRTPWLLWTLLFAVLSVLSFIGPIEVLLPFVISGQLDGGPEMFGFALAALGIGAAIGSMTTASLRLPRRYLTVMIMLWGFGALPLAAVGFVNQFWQLAAILLVCGATGGVGQVIWGTLLQRRVPQHMLGRVSSLDFFVSLALMPVSMALAGPIGEVVPFWIIFVVAGAVSPVIGVIAWLAARMPQDEIEHPLDSDPAPAPLASA